MIDWLNPSDDILEARNIGRHDRDVEVESLEAEVERLMVLATRYNDERITAELEVERQRERADRAEEKVLHVVRGEFGQICSYCGWESPVGGGAWEDLQTHVKECPVHPLRATRARIETLEDCIRNARAVLDGMYSMNHRGGWIAVAPIVDKAIREIDALLSPAPPADPSAEAKEEKP